MDSFYAMQGANGKWFTLKDNESIRLPIFRSNSEAIQARGRTRGMIFYRPAVFDIGALKALISAGEITICFWLVSNPKKNVTNGQPLTSEQLRSLINSERNKQKDSIHV